MDKLILSGKHIQSFHKAWNLDPRTVKSAVLTTTNGYTYPLMGEYTGTIPPYRWTFLKPGEQGAYSAYNIEGLVEFELKSAVRTILWYHRYEVVTLTVEFN